jgi:hypothetical protein
MVLGQALNGCDGAFLDVFQIDNAGTLGFIVNENRADTAFGNAAGVFHARNPKVVPQYPQQGGFRFCINLSFGSIHIKCDHISSFHIECDQIFCLS